MCCNTIGTESHCASGTHILTQLYTHANVVLTPRFDWFHALPWRPYQIIGFIDEKRKWWISHSAYRLFSCGCQMGNVRILLAVISIGVNFIFDERDEVGGNPPAMYCWSISSKWFRCHAIDRLRQTKLSKPPKPTLSSTDDDRWILSVYYSSSLPPPQHLTPRK